MHSLVRRSRFLNINFDFLKLTTTRIIHCSGISQGEYSGRIDPSHNIPKDDIDAKVYYFPQGLLYGVNVLKVRAPVVKGYKTLLSKGHIL